MMMRPILMIEGLDNLHDARYCAAVGIAMATFDLSSGSGRALAPGSVHEMLDWLSGLDGVGVFGHELPREIAERAAAAGVGRVMLPIDYDLEAAEEIGLALLFDCGSAQDDPSIAAMGKAALQRHPDALLVLPAGAKLADVPLERCILRCDDASALLEMADELANGPYGFCLGAFARDAEGILDYDACDALTSSFFQADLV